MKTLQLNTSRMIRLPKPEGVSPDVKEMVKAAEKLAPASGRRPHPAHVNPEAIQQMTQVRAAAMTLALQTGRAATDVEVAICEKLTKNSAGVDFGEALNRARREVASEIGVTR